MLSALWLGLVLFSPSPDRYFADLASGSWKQIEGNAMLEFLGDGSAEVHQGTWTVVPEAARVKQLPDLILPAPIWKNHRWKWKGSHIREADWEWQLLKDTLELPAHWLGGKRGEKWTFVQYRSPQFLLPPAPDAQLVAENQNAWKKQWPQALATGKPKKICQCLAKIDFPDKETSLYLKEQPAHWKCLQPHARLRLALLLEYSNAEIKTLLKK